MKTFIYILKYIEMLHQKLLSQYNPSEICEMYKKNLSLPNEKNRDDN